ncbi:hypothetical protein G5B40_15590 [Pikeienuella piscinae]|uniref:Uncharacterized protein n=1 Tax=Pikeienuella piscinae TaxID=2748098 RepID=A0A7L5BWE5_9RHOB|nr:hypothetical protein [Pikeienuella piscinae]QIE56730.1 hypothetical protein G5B40_15590 [Pikeienuella piscinae]
MSPIDHVLEHFPGQDATARRLYLRDEQFRSICEEFHMSIESLRRFEERSDAPTRPEIDDYRTLLRELGTEIRQYLAAADDG